MSATRNRRGTAIRSSAPTSTDGCDASKRPMQPSSHSSTTLQTQSDLRLSCGESGLVHETVEALEVVIAEIIEAQLRAIHEIDDVLAEEHLSRGGQPTDPLGDVHAQTEDVAAAHLDLAGVHASAHGHTAVR